MIEKKGIGHWVFTVLNTCFMVLIILVCLIPMLHVLFASFSDPMWVMNQSGLILWPHEAHLNGYKIVFQNQLLMGSYLNTFFYVFTATAIGLLVTVLGAFALSRRDALWGNPLMLIISFTMLFNGGLIPFYMVINGLGMFDSAWAVILPSCVSAFNLILVRTAMFSIPASLEESAKLDGQAPPSSCSGSCFPSSRPPSPPSSFITRWPTGTAGSTRPSSCARAQSFPYSWCCAKFSLQTTPRPCPRRAT